MKCLVPSIPYIKQEDKNSEPVQPQILNHSNKSSEPVQSQTSIHSNKNSEPVQSQALNNSNQNDKHIICSCGIRIYPNDKAFTVYDKTFCSVKCLTSYKKEEEEKRKSKQTQQLSRSYNGGGATCF